MTEKIRNFCIIAHIDHGKSTLADRLLEITETVAKRDMKAQILDQMDLERERGITIKLQPATMNWHGYQLNLIDTPGHVDFTYEVSRSLAAVEGAVLLVDATQGVQAQTLSNLYLAMEQNLTIIPVLNKVDLFNARPEETAAELAGLLGIEPEDILQISAKSGLNVDKLLQTVIDKVPPPRPQDNPCSKSNPAPRQQSGHRGLRALIFDSKFDDYKGVLAYVRIIDGAIKKGEKIFMLAAGKQVDALEVGVFKPQLSPLAALESGQIGYIATGLKDVANCRVGDTITSVEAMEGGRVEPLQGYKEVKPMVFAGLYCQEGDDFAELKEALDKLHLTDGALSYEQEQSGALGPGYRCGFLGLLHLDIVQERLRREYNLKLVITSPTVAYRVTLKKGLQEIIVHSPQELPTQEAIEQVQEPWMKVEIVSPENYLGAIMEFVREKRGTYLNHKYFNQKLTTFAKNVIIQCELPLTSLVADFYDNLKSITSGFASLNYEFMEYRSAQIRKLQIIIADETQEALSNIVYEDNAYYVGRKVVKLLKEHLPRQMFEIKVQAAVGGNIIAAERVPAMRKDVTAGLYGGDVSRKRKVLEKQKKGKKKMKAMGIGKVDIPPEVYLSVLKK